MHDVDCLLEHFHGTPSLDDVRECVRKLLSLHHRRRLDAERDGRPSPPFPRLWVLSPGRPEAAIDRLALAPRPGWPSGVLEAAPGWGLFLVVLRELPRTRDTLLLRLLGSGPLLREALRELASLPKRAWERRIVMPHLTAWRVAMAQDLQGLTDEEKDVMKNLDEIYRAWELETKEAGRRKGRREGRLKGRLEGQRLTLMKLLEARFGVLSDTAVARLEAADVAQLDAWTDRLLTASSLPELLGDA